MLTPLRFPLLILLLAALAGCSGHTGDESVVLEPVDPTGEGDDGATDDGGSAEDDETGDDNETGDDGDAGDESTTSATIGPDGGTLASTDGLLELEIPPGAVATATEFRIRTGSCSDAGAGLVGAAHGGCAGPAYFLEPVGFAFENAAQLNLPSEGSAAGPEGLGCGLPSVILGTGGAIGGPGDIGCDGAADPIEFEVPIEVLPEIVFAGETDTAAFTAMLAPTLLAVGESGGASAEIVLAEDLIFETDTSFSGDLTSADPSIVQTVGRFDTASEMSPDTRISLDDPQAFTCLDVGSTSVTVDLVAEQPSNLSLATHFDPQFRGLPNRVKATFETTVACTEAIASLQTRLIVIDAILSGPEALTRGFNGTSGASGFGAASVTNPFPVPNATADSVPVFVAGESTAPDAGTSLLAIDARSGEVLFDYEQPGNFFDALPLASPLDADDSALTIFVSGDGRGSIGIEADGTLAGNAAFEGFAAFYPDANYHLGRGDAVTLVQQSRDRILRFAYGDEDFEGFFADLPHYETPFPITAVTNETNDAMLVVSNPGLPQLAHVTVNDDDSFTTTVVGELGSDPRRLRCADLGAEGWLCAVSDRADGTVTPILWDGGEGLPTIGDPIAVGAGPVGLDLLDRRIVVAGFDDDSVTLIKLQAGAELQGDPVTTTIALANIPAVSACMEPGHALFLRDGTGAVAVSCNGSGAIAILAADEF